MSSHRRWKKPAPIVRGWVEEAQVDALYMPAWARAVPVLETSAATGQLVHHREAATFLADADRLLTQGDRRLHGAARHAVHCLVLMIEFPSVPAAYPRTAGCYGHLLNAHENE